MQIDVRHASHPEAVRNFDTETLRRHFLVETIFEGGEIRLTYSHYDRMVIGGATPLTSALTLTAPTAIGQETFLAERELGALNIGGAAASLSTAQATTSPSMIASMPARVPGTFGSRAPMPPIRQNSIWSRRRRIRRIRPYCSPAKRLAT